MESSGALTLPLQGGAAVLDQLVGYRPEAAQIGPHALMITSDVPLEVGCHADRLPAASDVRRGRTAAAPGSAG